MRRVCDITQRTFDRWTVLRQDGRAYVVQKSWLLGATFVQERAEAVDACTVSDLPEHAFSGESMASQWGNMVPPQSINVGRI